MLVTYYKRLQQTQVMLCDSRGNKEAARQFTSAWLSQGTAVSSLGLVLVAAMGATCRALIDL